MACGATSEKVNDVKFFLRFRNVYWKFIRYYSEIVKPVTETKTE